MPYFVSVILCLLFLSPSFAGGFIANPLNTAPQNIVRDETVPEDYIPVAQEPVVIDNTRTIVLSGREDALTGFALGFYSDIPTIILPPFEFGISASNLGGKLLAKWEQTILIADQGYTSLHYGAAVLTGSQDFPLGLFVGVEAHTNRYTSVVFDIYPVRWGSNWIIGQAIFGGRLYF